MSRVSVLNNQAAALLRDGRLAEAEETLDRTREILDQRPPAVPTIKELEPALDEYFYRSHRAQLGWIRQRYQDALSDALRAWTLENEIYAAARASVVGDLSPYAFSMGAWSAISLLTRCRRFEEAAQAFEAVVADRGFFEARRRRDQTSAEKVLLAGLCVFFEPQDDAWLRHGRDLVTRAQQLGSTEDPELAYGYACYWARVGAAKQALDALEVSLRRGVAPVRAFEDADLRPLHTAPLFERLVLDRVFTWRLNTEPPGARVFLDGVDTGRLTPTRLRPPKPGRHQLHFELTGFQENDLGWEHTTESGIDVTVRLVSLDELAEQKRTAEDAQHAPTEAARAKTRAFLGSDEELVAAQVRVERATTYGLGGTYIVVRGDGRLEIHHERFGHPSLVEEHRAKLGEAVVKELFSTFVEEAFTEMLVAPHTGVPDEPHFTIALTNARGTVRQLGKFVSARHQRFDRLRDLVWRAVTGTLDQGTSKRLGL